MSSLRLAQLVFIVSVVGALLGFAYFLAWDNPLSLLFSSVGLTGTAVAMGVVLVDHERHLEEFDAESLTARIDGALERLGTPDASNDDAVTAGRHLLDAADDEW